MKKKVIYLVGGIVLLVLVILSIVLLVHGKGNNNTGNEKYPDTLLGIVLKNKGIKMEDNPYKKFIGGEILSKDTWFNEYTFISSNKAYIFDPAKLKSGEVSYKLVYTIPDNIKIVNIGTPYGADIYFYSDDDHKYRVRDTNIDNDVKDEYAMFERATYDDFGDYSFNKENYTVSRYKQKVDYDIICNMFYVKDNVLYELVEEYYHYQEKRWVPFKIEKVEGNYEGETILDIYNDRIIRTDKGFYEIVKYYDKDGNVKTTTLKMELPSKYYDEILTFTYEYVILNDYTLIPIRDVLTNRKKEYNYNYYVDKFEETLEEFVE